MSIVDVLQAEGSVTSRVEQISCAKNPSATRKTNCAGLKSGGGRTATGPAPHADRSPTTSLEAISLREAIDIAMNRRPEIFQAGKTWRPATQREVRQNQLLPTLSVQGRWDSRTWSRLWGRHETEFRRRLSTTTGLDSSSATPRQPLDLQHLQ